jgi:hypothetical protein
MSRNGSGVYSLVSGNPVVTGTAISSTWANNTLTDIANALTGSLASDGQTALTGNLNYGTNRAINLGNPVSAQDAVTLNYLTASSYTFGGTITFTNTIVGNINTATSATTATTATTATNANNLLNANWSTNLTPSTNTFTGSIATTTLTVTSTSNVIKIGAILSGTGVTANTEILNQLTSTGSAIVSPTFSIGGAVGAYTVTLSSGTSIAVGQLVTGTGLASGTLVVAVNGATVTLSNAFTVQAAGAYNFYTAGDVGTYTVNTAQTVSSTTITQSYTNFNIVFNGNTVTNIDPLGTINTITQPTGDNSTKVATTAFVANANKGLGRNGETYHDVTSSRALSTTYTNTKNYPIYVSVNCSGNGVVTTYSTLVVSGVAVATNYVYVGGSVGELVTANASAIVPPGATYSATGSTSLTSWIELY